MPRIQIASAEPRKIALRGKPASNDPASGAKMITQVSIAIE